MQFIAYINLVVKNFNIYGRITERLYGRIGHNAGSSSKCMMTIEYKKAEVFAQIAWWKLFRFAVDIQPIATIKHTHTYSHALALRHTHNDIIKYAVEAYKIFFDDSIKRVTRWYAMYHIMVGFTTIIAHCYHLLKSAYKYPSHILYVREHEQQIF